MTVPSLEQALDQTGINGKSKTRLIVIINKLIELEGNLEVAEVFAETIEELPRCCGSEYFDPKGFFYANHGVSDDCPMHGQHPKHPGTKRLKKYVGKDPAAIQEVQDAMENWTDWQKANQRVRSAKDDLNRLAQSLDRPEQIASGNRWY